MNETELQGLSRLNPSDSKLIENFKITFSPDSSNIFFKDSIFNSQKELKNDIFVKKRNVSQSIIFQRQAINLLKNENIIVGYTSASELYLEELLLQDITQLKEVLNSVYTAIFSNPELLQKFIEVISNLDYESLYPTNTILALGVINHTDVGVQEAALAAFEKWDDKRNLSFLYNINYATPWLKDYADDVINYLESC